uniref:Serine protease n=1 Tax=Futiania mangrovi TaxID=2959716 RepID=A0A9J6PAS5_9PROT|nr:serine protease [Futiania mangrovii]MCP1335545.1 serine protease [Futiania mangrovii]
MPMRGWPFLPVAWFGVALTLAGCGATVSPELVMSQRNFQASMENAARDVRSQDWDGAIAAARAAKNTLPVQGSTAGEDGNFAYSAFQADALVAWAMLASGDTQAAEIAYRNVFDGIRNFENQREARFRDKVSSARIWEAFGSALMAAGAAYDSGLRGGDVFQPSLYAANKTLAANLPEGLSARVVEQTGIDPDGIRITLMPAYDPLTNIGRLVSPEGTCTASLVGPALALTNAHCVTSYPRQSRSVRAGRWPASTRDIHILFEGLYLPDRVRVVDVTLNDGASWRVRYDGDYSNDWALLELDRHPAGRGWFGTADLSRSEAHRIFIAGHSGDLNDGRFLTVHWDCLGTLKGGSPILHHSCATAPGSSGTPILLTQGDRKHHYIVALNAFKYEDAGGGGPRTRQFQDAVNSKLAGIRGS